MHRDQPLAAVPNLWIFVPCFHDTQSFAYLKRCAEESVTKVTGLTPRFVVVDDSGGQDLAIGELETHDDTIVLTAPYNLGHQAAIVFGLRRMASILNDNDFVVTMDSDGEDRPQDIPDLIAPLLAEPNNLFGVSLAQRTKRNESLTFRVLYTAFKIFFKVLTGTLVRNGNFAAFRGWFVRHVIFHPYFDYCYSSSLLALPLNRHDVPLARGVRYFGKSKMTLLTLVSHGFRMLLPFAERIAIRAIIISSVFFGSSAVLAAIYAGQQFMHGGANSLVMVAALALFAFAVAVAANSCIFFQVFNQTRAISLRTLTCSPSESIGPELDLRIQECAAGEFERAGALEGAAQ
jgi:hypothetical protein